MNKVSVLALLVAIAAIGISFFHAPREKKAAKETAFERVLRTGTIRCGYGIWYPEMMKDPNTGKLSGYDYDVVNELGKVLKLKVEWVEEINWGAAEQGMVTGRYDIACNSFWAHPPRAKAAEYSVPFIYLPTFPILRADLDGPSDNYAWLNDPKYRMIIFGGTVGEIVAEAKFPKAQLLDAFTLTTDGDALTDIATGKADFAFANWTTANRFMEQNPGKLKILPVMIEVTSGALLLPNDDPRMKVMVDKAITYLLDSGFVRQTMTRYMGNDQRAWLHPAAHYEAPQKYD